MQQDAMLLRIQKLLAKAESAEKIGNQAEAEAFAAKVQELLLAHRLTMQQVKNVSSVDEEPVEQIRVDLKEHGVAKKHTTRRGHERDEDLFSTVAKAHMCRALISSYSNTLWFVGRKADADVALYVFIVLHRTMQRLATRAYYHERDRIRAADDAATNGFGQAVEKSKANPQRGFYASFMDGFVLGIAERYAALGKRTSETGVDTSKALVVLKNQLTVVDDWMSKQVYGSGASKKARRNHQHVGAAFTAGRTAAGNVNLSGAGVSGKNGSAGSLGS